jgi:hypothetical protein
LELFIRAANRNPNCAFFFSAFQNVIEDSNHIQVVRCNMLDKIMLWLSPLHLFGKVYVGNPSCTFIRSDVGELYDKEFKFVVDFEYYIRCFKKIGSYKYIDEVLLSIGFNTEQVTKFTFLVPEVQIPENLILLNNLGSKILKNIVVYDYYWRIFRNLKIRSCEQISAFYPGSIHPSIRQMLKFQSRFTLSLLQKGFLSKPLMFVSYLKNLLNADKNR